MNSRELPFREIDGSSFLVLTKGPAGGCQAEPMVLRAWNRAGRFRRRGAPQRKIKAFDVLPVNRTMKKYKIYVTNNLNFFTSRFLNFRYIFAIQNPSPGGQVSSVFTLDSRESTLA